MPKVEIKKSDINGLLKKKLSDDELEKILESAKAELDEVTDDFYKIELNDTNRPDLWTSAGIARQINQYMGLKNYNYSFFTDKSEYKIIIDKNIQNIRPYIVGFGVKNIKIDANLLLELIQNQEKFAFNFGKKRADIAIGIYKFDRIKFPVKYQAVNPEKKKFIPLGEENEMTLKNILKEHPKGIEFGHIIKNYEEYPLIFDSNDNVLSMPPIINSRYIGEVETEDNEIFIELTGFNLTNMLLVANIFACDLTDRGAGIIPVKMEYSYETEYGKSFISPYCFKNETEIGINEFDKLIGYEPDKDEIINNLKKMGYYDTTIKEKMIITKIPQYRKDIMHFVDVAEDYIIGKGYNNFDITLPSDYTVGALSKDELFCDKLRNFAVGMEFQEIISNILSSEDNVYKKLNSSKNKDGLQISNPMTESYNVLRNSILSSLLEVEVFSAKSVYPHKIFEIGEIVKTDKNDNYGFKTQINICFLSSHPKTNFSEMRSYIDNILYYIGIDNFNLKSSDHSFLLPGRSADIIYKNKKLGYFGEINPEVLENWDINMPCSVIELVVDELLDNA